MTCSVCGSERIFRRGRCDRDYRYWLSHDHVDRVLSPKERSVRAERMIERRLQRENVRAAILYAGG